MKVQNKYLDVGFSFVCDLHQELCLRINHMLQDAFIHTRNAARLVNKYMMNPI
jgi:hypothetical protein